MPVSKSNRRAPHYYDSDEYPAGSSHVLGMLPGLFGGPALYAGLDAPRTVSYKPAKRFHSYPLAIAPMGSYRIRQRDFGMGSRKFSMASLRRYKVYLRRRKFYKAAHKLFF